MEKKSVKNSKRTCYIKNFGSKRSPARRPEKLASKKKIGEEKKKENDAVFHTHTRTHTSETSFVMRLYE